MKKIVLTVIAAIAFSGCLLPDSEWETGTVTLEYEKHYDFDELQYREYPKECAASGGAYKGIEGVADIVAYPELSTMECSGFSGLDCEETGFGVYPKPNENIMALGEISLEQASVPAGLEGEWEHCAGIGNSYYLKTWQDKDVLFEVTGISEEGITINYKMRSPRG